MRREVPCKECRYRRKKCVRREDNEKICERCLKLDIDCHPLKNKNEIIPLTIQEDDHEIRSWATIINQLETELKELEIVKANLEQCLIRRKHPRPNEWQLSITNGIVKLETPIRTMEELVMFSQASLRYLSPFAGMFNKQPVRFESMPISVPIGVSSVLQRHEMLKQRRKRFTMIEYNSSNQSTQIPSVSNYHAIMDFLIPAYLKHQNAITGLLHESTFREYYRNLDDPMEDPLALAVCVDALVALRNLIGYTPSERCVLAEVFYERCRDKLFDMYDDPNKKLQVVVISSLLPMYVGNVLLNCLEANRIIAIALLICADLTKDFDKMTPVEAVVFQRNYFHLETCSRMHKMLYEDKVDFAVVQGHFELKVLDDEPEKTKMFMRLYNHIFRLVGSRYISEIVGKFNGMFYGRSGEMPLEDILQYEPVIKDWWDSLPSDLKLCDDPFSSDGFELVQERLSSDKLIPFTVVHLLTSIFMASILQPQAMPASDDNVTAEAIQIIKANSVSLALHSCRILVYALEKNWDPYTSDQPNFSFAIILYGIYALERLSSCDDLQVPRELLALLKRSLDVKFSSLLPEGHMVPSSVSPLVSYIGNAADSTLSPYEFYENYPFPGYALLADVLLTSIKHVEQKLYTAY
ncbi:hypothetical protein BJV82DRAFT_63596 [Fennellomyces sp. T-0311]|nr:hypothetical protein BJV82DRAFT_63596 [Fennellomyces sp. T-0311]